MIALLAAALAAAQTPAPQADAPAGKELPYQIEFARTQLGPWQIEASSFVRDETGVPMRGDVQCEIARAGIKVQVWSVGQLSIRLGGSNLRGDQLDLSFRPEEIRQIELDGSAWEYGWLGRWPEHRKFADLTYPAPPRDPPGWDHIHHPIMSVLYGAPAVRRGPGTPWFDLDLLANALLKARRLRIGYADDESSPEPLLWAEVPLDGLGEALAWCDSAMNGERSRLFHADLEP